LTARVRAIGDDHAGEGRRGDREHGELHLVFVSVKWLVRRLERQLLLPH
jgi:hypothetical protein